MKNIGKPCAGKPHARFDEGGQGDTCSLLYPAIEAGGSCTVNISFAPNVPGTKSATLRIASNATTNPIINIPLSGRVAIPLSVTLTGDAAGSVQPSPSPGGNCYSGSCSYSYLPGTVVTLTATPAAGSTFTGCGATAAAAASARLPATAAVPVLRGGSRRPLLVTAVGMDLRVAARCLGTMHGEHRMPTLLKRADHLSRSWPDGVAAP